MRTLLRQEKTRLFILVAAGFVLYATAARDGHDWGGDYAQYILHAQSLLDGTEYAPLRGYVENDYLPWAPYAYPPVFPAYLATILTVFGLDFVALKIGIIALLALGYLAYYRIARDELSPAAALGVTAFLVFSPFFLKFSNKVLSDLPFLAVSFAYVAAANRFFKDDTSRRDMLILGLTMIAGIGTRAAGLTMLVALPAYALLFRRNHFFRATAITVLVTVVFLAFSSKMVGMMSGQIGASPVRILGWFINNLVNVLPYQLTRFFALYPKWGSQAELLINTPFAVVFAVLALIGLVSAIRRRGVRFVDVFLAAQLRLVLSFVLLVLRYLIPVIPLLSIHAFIGLRVVAIALWRKVPLAWRASGWRRIYAYRYAIPVAVFAPLFAAYWGQYALRPTTTGANILRDPQVSSLFDTIRHSDVSAAVFHRPRVLTLFTDKPSTTCFNTTGEIYKDSLTWDLAKLKDLSRKSRVSHVILDHSNSSMALALRPIVNAHPGHFRLVYSNDGFEVFEILSESGLTDRPAQAPGRSG